MAQRHTWFATKSDADLILAWLRNAGAVVVNGDFPTGGWAPDRRRELILHFPQIGPLEFWPDQVRPSDYPENSPRWREAVLNRIRQTEDPGTPQVDADRSAAAGLRLPEFRDSRYWVSGCLWFPGSRLKEAFPELAKVCARFQRFLLKNPVVFDNTKGEHDCGFDFQLCKAGIVQRVVALPEAYALLRAGAFMIDHMTSPKCYAEFRRKLQLIGRE